MLCQRAKLTQRRLVVTALERFCCDVVVLRSHRRGECNNKGDDGGLDDVSHVRITAQLTEAKSGNHLWAEKYDGDLADIFDLQDDITSSVVGAIHPQILSAEIEHAKRVRPGNIVAYDLYLRGLWHQIQMTKESFAEARDLYRSCLDADSEEIALGLGYSANEVAELKEKGVLRAG